jgi:hypothetical protein
MNLATTQLKDTYGNLLTIGTSAGSPTTGTIENGDGQDITALDVNGSITTNGLTIDQTSNVVLDLNTTNSNGDITLNNVSYGVRLRTNSAGGFSVMPADTTFLNVALNGDVNFYDDTGVTPAFFWDASAESLGIGTTSPSAKLEVQDGSISVGSSTNTSTTNTLLSGYGYILSGTKIGNTSITSTYNNSNNSASLEFYTDPNGSTPTERMRIQSSGAIGINNSSPDSFATSVSTSSSLVIGQGALGVSPGLTLWQGNSAQATINFASANTGAGQYEGRIRYTRDTGVMDFRTNGLDNVLVLNSSGNVGIGTSPSYPLEVDTGAGTFSVRAKGGSSVTIASDASLTYFGDTHEFSNSAGTSEFMRIDSSGRMGIGDIPKTQHSNVTDSLNVGSHLTFQRTKDTYIASNFYYNSSDAGKSIASGWSPIYQQDVVNGKHIWYNATASATGADETVSINPLMTIDSSGNVLVGKTATSGVATGNIEVSNSSSASLQIEGGTHEWSMLVSSSADALRFYQDSDERMRIASGGTTTITATSGSSLQNGTLLLKTTNASNNAGLMFINSGNTSSFNDIAGIASFVESGDAKGNLRFWTRNSDGDNSDVDERMRIDSSGNVGIGQTSPDLFAFSGKELHVKGGTGTNKSASFIAESAQSASGFLGGYYWVNGSATNEFQKRVGQITVTAGTNADRSEMDFLVKQGAGNYSTAMRIDSSGRLLVGTTSALAGFSGTAQRACFSATGDTMTVAVGTGTGAYTGIHIDRTSSDGKAISFERGDTDVGSISITTTATAYNTSSDYRLKENVVELTGALDRVDQLNPSRFNFIADANTTVDGFLAHEVADVVPEAITGEKDATEEYEVTPAVLDDEGNVIEEAVMGTRPVYQGIDQSKLVPLLVGAIQELRAEIEQLKNQ